MKITTTDIVTAHDNPDDIVWQDVQRVVIELADGRTVEIHESGHRERTIDVHTNSDFGDEELVIRPRYTHTVEIALVPR